MVDPATSTTETVACTTTRALRAIDERSPRAAAGAAKRVDRIGARGEPRRRGAEQDAGDERERESERQNRRRRRRVDRQECDPRKRERQQQTRRADRDGEAGDAAGDREEDALDQGLHDDLPPRGADREPDGGLRPPRDGAREQQVGDVGAGDEQHQAAHAEKNLQAARILLLHDRRRPRLPAPR